MPGGLRALLVQFLRQVHAVPELLVAATNHHLLARCDLLLELMAARAEVMVTTPQRALALH